jgi:hypothetical protein
MSKTQGREQAMKKRKLTKTDNASEYSGYYLDKSYRYFVCNQGVSFDDKGETVMTHGGISLDEVIVPFIKIKGVKELG